MNRKIRVGGRALIMWLLFSLLVPENVRSATRTRVSFPFGIYQSDPFMVTGKISDAKGVTLPGVSIYNKSTKKGTVSNGDGGFSIQASDGDIISIMYIGFEGKVIVANSSNKTLNIVLKESSTQLDDVVITALNIKREERSLGYAVTEVGGDALNKAKETNVINSLAGKVAGVVINSSAGGPSGASRVVIRGATSITGDNQPLYVIDGVPMDNNNYGQVGNTKFAGSNDGGVDMGDAISAINPDDIEKISVLKGASATALYGSMAGNGVILITTKRGTNAKDLGIEFSSTSTIENQLTKVNGHQSLYGQGRSGQIPSDLANSRDVMFLNFGPRLDPNMNIISFDGVMRPYGLVENNFSNFFRSGSSLNNTLALTSSTPTSNFRFSVSDLRYKDIIPNSDIRRNNFTFSSRSKFGKKLSLDARVVYLNEKVKNRAGLGDSPTNIGQNFSGLGNNIDHAIFKDTYKAADGSYIEWGGGPFRLNPYWVLNDMSNLTKKDRVTGSFNTNYDFNKVFSLQARASTDITYLDYEKYSPISTPLSLVGALNVTTQKYLTNNADLLLAITKPITPAIGFSARLGASINRRQRIGTTALYSNMTVPDVTSLNSFQDRAIEENDVKRGINSLYALTTFSFKRYLYLDATLRRDVSSTLPKGNHIYWYPSLSTSFVFTDAFKISNEILSFGKFRASIAEVGIDTDPYQLNVTYSNYPYTFNGTQPSNIATKTNPNTKLKPTRTRSFETGTNLKFFKNRINFDASYYTSKSRDQINTVPIAFSSGYQRSIINAGMISNEGVELLLSGSPIAKKDFDWEVTVNFARNVSKVESLADGVTAISLADARWLGLSVVAMPGEKYGAILGYDSQKDPNGNIILDPTNNLAPKVATTRQVLGKGVFDWTGGLVNRVSYKQFTLNAAFDIKYGADLFSMTDLFAVTRGSSAKTLPGRDEWIRSEELRLEAKKTPAEWQALGNVRGYVPQGVIEGVDANGNKTFTPNTRAVDPSVYWGASFTNGNGVATPYIYKATYVKVREITLLYRLPKKLNTTLGLKDASFGLVARNPFIIYKDVPNIDPDSNYNNGNGQGLEYGSLPSRRGWGFNLNIKF